MRAAHAESAVRLQPDNAALHALVLAEYGRKAAWAARRRPPILACGARVAGANRAVRTRPTSPTYQQHDDGAENQSGRSTQRSQEHGGGRRRRGVLASTIHEQRWV